MAELLGVTPLWYALFESGRPGRRFSAAFLERLSDVLRLDEADREVLWRLVVTSGAATREVELEWNAQQLRELIALVAQTSRHLARASDARHAAETACRALRSLLWLARTDVTVLRRIGHELEVVWYEGAADRRSIVGRRMPSPALDAADPHTRSVVIVPMVGAADALLHVRSPFANAYSQAEMHAIRVVASELEAVLASMSRGKAASL